MNRREIIIGGASAATIFATPTGFAQQPAEILIGGLYQMSGSNGQVGIDAQHAFNTALDVINNAHPELDLPLAKNAGLAGLGGAKVKLIIADHQGDPQRGRAEAERLITQEKVCALIGSYQSAVAVTISQVGERYSVPYLSAENSSPSLHRQGLKYFFRPGAQDEMFSKIMFDFFDFLKTKGKKISTLALFHEDTIFGTDSANAQGKLAEERGYKVVANIRYRANSPSLTSEVQQLKLTEADVLMPTSYTTDSILLVKTMDDLGYKPKNIMAQDAGFSEKAFYDAVGDKIIGSISRASFSIDLLSKRQASAKVNEMYKARSGKDLNDLTSREFMGLLVLVDAIDRAKSIEGPKIREALTETNIPGEMTIMPWKQVKFGPDGQNMDADPVLIQWTGQKFVTIYPEAVAAAEVKWPMNG